LQTIWPRAAAAAGMYNTFLNPWYGMLHTHIYVYTHIPLHNSTWTQLRQFHYRVRKWMKNNLFCAFQVHASLRRHLPLPCTWI
jgi:hypothetical protein